MVNAPTKGGSKMKAEMETFYCDAESEKSECEIIIRETELVVSYADDDGPVIYSGAKTEWGYVLTCPSRRGRATLHQSSEHQFEGSWTEGGYRGMWVIDVDDE